MGAPQPIAIPAAVNLAGSGEVAWYDWIIINNGDRLHAPAQWNDPDYCAVDASTRTACGRSGMGEIPGVLTRIGAQRCRMCCRSVGMPEGKGSPKNDTACRPLVGLSAE